MTDKKRKLIFIHQLRAVAALMVIAWHLGIMFWYSNETISSTFFLKPISGGKDNLNFLYTNIVEAFMNLGFDFGRFGVAIFFLISGFIIPYSIKENNEIKAKIMFLVKRVLRIWPVYICGFSIAFLVLFCYTKITYGNFTYSVKDYLIQASLLRDWFWVPSIDGISWTLEVEIKFYLLIFVLLLFNKLYSKSTVAILSMVMALYNILLFANTEKLILYNVRLYQIMSVIGDSFIYLTFVLIGLAFYCLYSGKWDKSIFFLLLQCLIFSFLLSILNSGNKVVLKQFVVNYLGAILLFGDFYLMRDRLKENKFLSFMGDKSFAIYLLHGLTGYVLLSVFMDIGFPAPLCLVLSVGIVLLLVIGFCRFIEKPIQKVSGNIINKLQHLIEMKGS